MKFLDKIFNRQVVKGMDNSVNNKQGLNNIFYNYRTELAYNMYFSELLKLNKLKLPKSIVNTVVTTASQELTFNINSDSSNLNDIASFIRNNLKIAESHLCIGGQVAFKPYIKNNKVAVSVYGARDFVAFYDELGLLEKVYFKSDIRESELVSYTLVEIHTYDSDSREYKIENKLFSGVNSDWNRKVGKMAPMLGVPVPLSKCKKTANLEDFYVIQDVDHHLCSVVSLDNSMIYNKGRSIYDSSIDLINDAEKQYDSLMWEYKGGELAIDAAADLFKIAGSSKKYCMPDGKDRLYRRLEGASPDFNIQAFAPDLRDESYIRGLNEIIHKIEMNCGLYYGALTNVDSSERTATEVISSKQRFYVTVMDIKNRMKDGISDIIKNCCVINNRLLPSFMKEDVAIEFEIGDSVLETILPQELNK